MKIDLKKYISDKSRNPIKTPEQLLFARKSTINLVSLLVSSLGTYMKMHPDWQTKLIPTVKEFEDLLNEKISKNTLEETIQDMFYYTIDFIMSCPVFDIHELVKADAVLTDAEIIKFRNELMDSLNDGNKRHAVLPYVVTAGYLLIKEFQKEPTFLFMIEEYKKNADMDISMVILMRSASEYLEEADEVEVLLAQLKNQDVTINLDGTVEDKSREQHEN